MGNGPRETIIPRDAHSKSLSQHVERIAKVGQRRIANLRRSPVRPRLTAIWKLRKNLRWAHALRTHRGQRKGVVTFRKAFALLVENEIMVQILRFRQPQEGL